MSERYAIVCAQFYDELARRLTDSAQSALESAGCEMAECFEVPGAFELPLAAKLCAVSGRFAGVICLGAVIRGETDHYDYVCAESARGIQAAALETGVPCSFGVLTVDTMEQAMERSGGGVRDGGRNAAEAVLALVAVKRQLAG
ncbi:MAG: 6,7-dimethyl-8-ribityllumazine synthase [Actinobacteria bacterium]|uniref:6,7-dimethyl-8-ribityllumazine synthase n=1 Tax=freshwater metagenome TaxID=449393 RepID=A0A6J5ZUH8_9ZZZZ|nr:6,7-dimethyl-8-ribityllumazine synthase [Actinomycetota bacterium]